MEETFKYSTDPVIEPEAKIYIPTRPHILKYLNKVEKGQFEEVLIDNSRYPGDKLREIRKNHK